MNENKQTVLTDEEIRAQIDECSMMAFPLRWINFARAIESAVLSKLRVAGEPVAFKVGTDLFFTRGAADKMAEKRYLRVVPLYAAPQASVEAGLIEEVARQWDGCEYDSPGGSIDIGAAIRTAADRLKSAPAAEASAKGAGDVALPPLPSRPPSGSLRYTRKEIRDYARAAVLADRQQRGGDVGRTALEWYAEQAAGCRKLGAAGDRAREALDKDGGQRARAAMSATKGESNG